MMLLWHGNREQARGGEVLVELGRGKWRRRGAFASGAGVVSELDGELAGAAEWTFAGRGGRGCQEPALDLFDWERIRPERAAEELGKLAGLVRSRRRGGGLRRCGRWSRGSERWSDIESRERGGRWRLDRRRLGAEKPGELADWRLGRRWLCGQRLRGRRLRGWRLRSGRLEYRRFRFDRRRAEQACELALRRWGRSLDRGRLRPGRRRNGRRGGWAEFCVEPGLKSWKILLHRCHCIGRLGRFLNLDDRTKESGGIDAHGPLKTEKKLGVVGGITHAPEVEQHFTAAGDFSSLERFWLAVLNEPNKLIPVVETHEKRPAESPSIIVAQQVRKREHCE